MGIMKYQPSLLTLIFKNILLTDVFYGKYDKNNNLICFTNSIYG